MRIGRALAPLTAMVFAAAAPRHGLAADWSTARKVTVVAVEYAFKPAALTFHKGVAYRLRVDNRGKEMHEFTAPEMFKRSKSATPRR